MLRRRKNIEWKVRQGRGHTPLSCRTLPKMPETWSSFWDSSSLSTASLYWPLHHHSILGQRTSLLSSKYPSLNPSLLPFQTNSIQPNTLTTHHPTSPPSLTNSTCQWQITNIPLIRRRTSIPSQSLTRRIRTRMPSISIRTRTRAQSITRRTTTSVSISIRTISSSSTTTTTGRVRVGCSSIVIMLRRGGAAAAVVILEECVAGVETTDVRKRRENLLAECKLERRRHSVDYKCIWKWCLRDWIGSQSRSWSSDRGIEVRLVTWLTSTPLWVNNSRFCFNRCNNKDYGLPMICIGLLKW